MPSTKVVSGDKRKSRGRPQADLVFFDQLPSKSKVAVQHKLLNILRTDAGLPAVKSPTTFRQLRRKFADQLKRKKELKQSAARKKKKRGQRQQRSEVFWFHGSLVERTDKGHRVVVPPSTFRAPDGTPILHTRMTPQQLAGAAMADKAARQNFEEASDEAREALKHREPGVSASAVCRDIERRRYLLPGALNPDTLHLSLIHI